MGTEGRLLWGRYSHVINHNQMVTVVKTLCKPTIGDRLGLSSVLDLVCEDKVSEEGQTQDFDGFLSWFAGFQQIYRLCEVSFDFLKKTYEKYLLNL